MTFLRILLLAILIAPFASAQGQAFTVCKGDGDRNCFTGRFGLTDIPGDPAHKLIAHDFGFLDSKGVGWQTNAGAKTDGASIPPLLRPLVGSPWEEDYIRAAVIHDWYCVRRVQTWQDTHRVFYDAMLASGMKPAKAKLMFYAVYAFGPIWGWPTGGQTCSVTPNCTQSTFAGQPYVVVPDSYGDLKNQAELRAMEAVIDLAETGAGFSPEQLMAIADKAHPKPDLSGKPRATGITE